MGLDKVVLIVVLIFRWFHHQFVAVPVVWWLDNVLSTFEETTKAAIREIFSVYARVVNGLAQVVVAIFIDKGRGGFRKHSSPRRKRRSEAWTQFWEQNGSSGTLNAVIERELGGTEAVDSSTGRSLSRPRLTNGTGMKRSGSDLFDRPAGFGVEEQIGSSRRGLLETIKLWTEVSVEVVFAIVRGAISTMLALGDGSQRQHDGGPLGIYGTMGRYRSTLSGHFEDLNVWTTSDIILQSGYPLEEHVVTTRDGYILSMQRIPRKDSKNVVFFQHGVLDTSLGWVCNGPQGSQAFSAYDEGADVFLGNMRCNPPRAHEDPLRSGAAYWAYSINELAMEDIAALFERIDAVKRAELGSVRSLLSSPLQYKHGRSSSDPSLMTLDSHEVQNMHGDKKIYGKSIMRYDMLESPPKSKCTLKNSIIDSDEQANNSMISDEECWKQKLRHKSQSSKTSEHDDSGSTDENTSIFDRTVPLISKSGSRKAKEVQPYDLKVVAHSLGATCVLIYAVMSKLTTSSRLKNVKISRMVLLCPAGFHEKYPAISIPFLHTLPLVMKLLNRFRPGVGAPAYIPSSLLRYITFKLTVDLQQVPALNELTRAGLRLLFNGDSSEWDRALQMPHYAVSSMPALSVHTGAHLIQLIRTGKFELYDYGSAKRNMEMYGVSYPPNVSDHYDMLQDIAIDLVAGVRDGVIDREDVLRHYACMKEAGVSGLSYKEFHDMGHLDMTFAAKDDLIRYVIQRLFI